MLTLPRNAPAPRHRPLLLATLLFVRLGAATNFADPPEQTGVMRDAGAHLGETQTCQPGPWGQLEFTTTIVEPPGRIFGASALSSRPPVWPFTGRPAAELARALEAAGLPAPTVRELLAGAEHSNETTIIVRPPEDLLMSLDSPTRGRVYALLRDSSNPVYRYPIHINRRYAHTWLDGATDLPEARACLERLIYHQGEMAYFSDHRFLMSKIPGLAERRQLTMALLRQASVSAQLTVTNQAEARQLATYWGRGGREADVQRLLEAATNGAADISQLLPPIPRARLNTYQSEGYEQFLDCTWTALNFFHTVGDDRFLQPAVANRELLENYVSIPSGYQLGDLILLRNRTGRILHSCNYLADHLVFTKNGGDLAQPWIISTLREVANYYTIDGEAPEYLFLRERTPQSPIAPDLTALR